MAGEVAEFSLEYPCHSPTEQRWFMGRVTRIPDHDPVHIVVAHENITSRKQVKEALKHAHHNLETRVRERTDELHRANENLTKEIIERKLAEATLRYIAHGVSALTGEAFFQSLVKYLAQTLAMEYAFVGELIEEKGSIIRTIAVWADDAPAPNFEYDLAHTPCNNVVAKELCYYLHHVQQRFPLDSMLMEMGVESYIGIPLFDTAGQALGLVAVLGRKPLYQLELARSMLQVFAVRAEAELERKRIEESLRESEGKFRALLESAPIGIVIVDGEGSLVLVNAKAEEMFGYTPGELLGQSVEVLLPERYRATHILHRAGYLDHPRIRPMGANLDLVARRKDGTEFPVEVGLSFIKTFTTGHFSEQDLCKITQVKRDKQPKMDH